MRKFEIVLKKIVSSAFGQMKTFRLDINGNIRDIKFEADSFSVYKNDDNKNEITIIPHFEDIEQFKMFSEDVINEVCDGVYLDDIYPICATVEYYEEQNETI